MRDAAGRCARGRAGRPLPSPGIYLGGEALLRERLMASDSSGSDSSADLPLRGFPPPRSHTLLFFPSETPAQALDRILNPTRHPHPALPPARGRPRPPRIPEGPPAPGRGGRGGRLPAGTGGMRDGDAGWEPRTPPRFPRHLPPPAASQRQPLFRGGCGGGLPRSTWVLLSRRRCLKEGCGCSALPGGIPTSAKCLPGICPPKKSWGDAE